jgi:hypothetical protein
VFFYDEDQEDAHMGDGRLIPLTNCYLKKVTAEGQEGIEDGVFPHTAFRLGREVFCSQKTLLFQAIPAHHRFLFLFHPFESR